MVKLNGTLDPPRHLKPSSSSAKGPMRCHGKTPHPFVQLTKIDRRLTRLTFLPPRVTVRRHDGFQEGRPDEQDPKVQPRGWGNKQNGTARKFHWAPDKP